RLYRADSSRQRVSGGAGLGLAIVRSLVLAHGGQVHADASPLGGLKVAFSWPVAKVSL
ncbi:MAG: ATP-binding protein, partial [Aequoribacter sp.]